MNETASAAYPAAVDDSNRLPFLRYTGTDKTTRNVGFDGSLDGADERELAILAALLSHASETVARRQDELRTRSVERSFRFAAAPPKPAAS